ncbi:MAG TPA: hypothetical protein VE650_18910 [Acetobacteraceae bacterium]|nr:hypothetical protein [Acetobacteraceae bacterium]
MPLPQPELGLVVQYRFVWAGAGRGSPPDVGKSRPCLIVDLEQVGEPSLGGRLVTRVTYLPISHVAPRAAEQAIPVPPRVGRHIGLSHETSYVYTSYAVEDDWPFDLDTVPGTDGVFDYGLIPPKLFASVAEDFANYLAMHPRFVHQRSG